MYPLKNGDTEIFPVRIGYSNVVLIKQGTSSILTDTGLKDHLPQLTGFFRQRKVDPQQVKLIVVTHTHHDHTGNLQALAALTGAPVLVHRNEYENLKNGFTPIPKGQGIYSRFISRVGLIFRPQFASPKAFTADLVNENEFDLNPFGINAKVISTPGHTNGSQSIVAGEILIAGDTFINIKNGMIFPHFCDNPATLLKTWEMLFDSGIKTVIPGHGKPFPIEKAKPEFEKWKKKIRQTAT
jgi:glyoxylase-like metal-dependent hydrolase (beta-lactamase superfamily II)